MMLRRLTGALALLFVALSLAVPASALPTKPSAPSPDDLVTEITDITPIVEPGDNLKVSAVVRNEGEKAIKDAELDLRLYRPQLISRSSVELWEDPEDSLDPVRPTGQVVETKEVGDLAEGEKVELELTLSSDSMYLPLDASMWGPRGIAVDTRHKDDVLHRERTFMVWFPANPDTISPTDVSILAPLVSQPHTATSPLAQLDSDESPHPGSEESSASSGDATEPADENGLEEAEDTNTGSDDSASDHDDTADEDEIPRDPAVKEFQDLVETGVDHGLSWAVDPALFTVSDYEDQANVLKDTLGGEDVFALPKHDADVAAFAHHGDENFGKYLTGSRTTISQELGATSGDILLWPDTAVDQKIAQFTANYETDGVGAAVATGDQLPPTSPLSYTPSGKARVKTDSGAAPILLAEAEMSQRLIAASTAEDNESIALSRQRLLADSAVITQERPTDPRHILLTLPRDWEPNLDSSEEILKTLSAAAWINIVPARNLLGGPTPEVSREPLPSHHLSNAEVSQETLQEALNVADELSAFRYTVTEPELVLPRVDDALDSIVATSWRSHTEERDGLVRQIRDAVADLHNEITVIPGGTVNLITDSGEIPVLIANEFSQDATVTVELESNSSFLITKKTATAEIPAHSDKTVLVPVEAIGNQDVDVNVTLINSEGDEVGQPETITVRVRAGWEDAGTRIVGGVLILLFIIGIVRTIRRGRKRMES